MKNFLFDLQRFSVMPTLLNGEDGGGIRYWNTIPGAEVSGFGNTFFVNHGAGCIIYCDGNNTKVYNDTVAPNVVMKGAGGRDWLINDAINVKIYGYAGADDLLSYANNCELYGGTGDDAIQNRGGSNVKIYGGEDNDWIYNNGIDALIEADDGYDNIENYGAGANIAGGKNDDYIYNAMEGSESKIDGGADNDTILNGGDSVEIFGGDGDDSIDNTGNNVTIDGGANDDKIINSGGSKVSINAGAGIKNLVSVTSSSNEVTIEGADTIGVDLIYNESNGALIKGNAGFDDIKNSGVDVYMYGGADDDFLTNYGDNAHIYGEGGEDYIYSDNATDIIIDGGANDDDIFAYHDIRALVLGGAGDDRIYMNRVSVADKNELLKTLGIDSFSALLSLLKSHPKMGNLQYIPTTIGDWKDWAGEIGSKIIDAVADEKLLIPSIMGSMGNTVKIAKGAQPWITAISTVMTIWKYLDPNSLLQQLNTATSTVNGGKGNDIIVLDGFAPRVVSYSKGDGNDVIYNMATNQAAKERTGNLTQATHLSTLQVESGTIDNVTVDGKNVKLKIGTGSVELVDAACFRFKVRENGTLTTRIYGTSKGNTISSYYSGEKNLIIDGMDGNDNITNQANESTIIGGKGNDYIFNNGTNSGYGGLAKKVSISGGDGNDQIKAFGNGISGDNVTINGGANDDEIRIEAFKVLIEYAEGDGNDIVYGFDGNDTLKISALSYTLERKGFDLIVHVGNGSINLKGCRLLAARGKVNIDGTPESDLVKLEFYDMKLDGDKLSLLKLNPGEIVDVSDAPSEIRIIDATKSQTSVKIIGNSSVDKFTGSDKADVFYTEPPASQNSSDMMYEMASNAFFASNLLSTDSAEEASQIMTVIGGGGDDTIYGGKEKAKLYIYNANDGNDIIHNFSASDTLSISESDYSTKKSGDNIIVTVGTGKISLMGAASLSKVNIKGTKATSTTKNVTNSTKSPVTVGSAVKTINASKRTTAVKITSNSLANTITGGSKNDSIYGGAGNDSIFGNAGNDKLYGQAGNDNLKGGKGNDSLWGGKGNDSLWGGDGNDVFIYSAGKDVIADFTAGQDKIQIASGKISKSSLSGSDVIFTIGKGSLTVKNAKGKSISLLDSTGKASSTVVGAQTLSNSNKASVTIGADMGVVDASSRTKAIKIIGNSLANTITGGSKNDSIYGGAGNDSILGNAGNDKLYGQAGNDILKGGKGNDSLWGGKGNDSLWGDAGSDTFIYESGDGKDVFFGFENNDLLQITGAFSTSYSKKKGEIYFKVDSTSNAITLKDFSATVFNVNGTAYKISGSKLTKK